MQALIKDTQPHTHTHTQTHITHTQTREEYNNRQVWYESEQDFTQLIHSASSTYPPISFLFTHSGCCYSSSSVSTVFVFLTLSLFLRLTLFFITVSFSFLSASLSLHTPFKQFICVTKSKIMLTQYICIAHKRNRLYN